MDLQDDTPLRYDDIPDTLKLPFWLLRKFGLYTRNKYIKYTPTSLCILMSLVLLGLALFQYPDDVYKFILSLEEVLAYTHMIGKIIGLMITQRQLSMLFSQTKLFWKTDRCDEKTAGALNYISSSAIYLQKAMALILGFGIIFTMIFAYLLNTTIVGIWTLKGYDGLKQFRTVLQRFAFCILPPFLWGVDFLFIMLCAETVIQFRILCYCLRNLDRRYSDHENVQSDPDYNEKLIECIKYHQFILGFAKTMLSSFSIILLSEFMTMGPLVCAELYAASESSIVQLRMRHAIILSFHVIDIFCFCLAANYVTHEAEEVAKAIYFSKWYTQDILPLRTYMLILMQSAQKEIIVTAGGMLTVNAATALNILKMGWSLLSLMKGIK